MLPAKLLLLATLGVITIVFLLFWARSAQRIGGASWPTPTETAVGFLTNFFDTLGIGSFAPTTSLFKLLRLVPDERIPGTLNVGHTPPTVAQAFIFIASVGVEMPTLAGLIAASVAGAWLGAGVVAGLPRRRIQVGMGAALLVAATLFSLTNLGLLPGGGVALGLAGPRLALAIAGNFVLGALMTLGIGLYAPCMIMVSLLGMNPLTAFPIMMGSCAFLMPVGGFRFLERGSYSLRAGLGLSLGGVPGVLIAAFIVKSLPMTALRWLVAAVVVYTAFAMLRSAALERAPAMLPGPDAAPAP
ncbi:MAG TPA: sulfite exporter TauE/SafE family protein [Vicinamibacteria bacterium]|nr:sulfite exporter TauE/SafE family protein [Vicinamibacteria bacterium]